MGIEIRSMTPLLEVFDMPTTVSFYRDLVGFEVIARSGSDDNSDWVHLRLADVDLMLNTAYENDKRPPDPDPARVRAHCDTALFFGCPHVDGAYAYLRDRGVDLKPPHNAPYGMRQLYLTDPDGFNLCFQWPVSDR
jgi:catechol 2,3-dioxygenase-like lactoylglutathione lyase family enzyme